MILIRLLIISWLLTEYLHWKYSVHSAVVTHLWINQGWSVSNSNVMWRERKCTEYHQHIESVLAGSRPLRLASLSRFSRCLSSFSWAFFISFSFFLMVARSFWLDTPRACTRGFQVTMTVHIHGGINAVDVSQVCIKRLFWHYMFKTSECKWPLWYFVFTNLTV